MVYICAYIYHNDPPNVRKYTITFITEVGVGSGARISRTSLGGGGTWVDHLWILGRGEDGMVGGAVGDEMEILTGSLTAKAPENLPWEKKNQKNHQYSNHPFFRGRAVKFWGGVFFLKQIRVL